MKPLYIIAGILLIGTSITLLFGNSKDTIDRGALSASVINTTQSSEAPDFTLETLAGNSISLSSYEGIKPVILDFWASWCSNCRRAMPLTSKLYDDYAGSVEIIGVNLQERPERAGMFAKDNPVSFPLALDQTGRVSRLYGVRYTNTYVFIDRGGNVVGVKFGDIKKQDIDDLLAL